MKSHVYRFVFFALITVFGSALAFQPVDQNSLEIPLPAYDDYGFSSWRSDQGIHAVEAQLIEEFGGNWRVWNWNARTNTPQYFYGHSTALFSPLSDEVAAEQAARSLMSSQPEVFRTTDSDLHLSAVEHALGKWAVHFQQTWNGMEVWQGKAMALFSEDGRLVLAGSDFHSEINLDPSPVISSAQAEAIAIAALPYDPATDRIDTAPELQVLPYPRSEADVSYHLAWRLRVRTDSPLGNWQTWVDAHSGEILWRSNEIHFAFSGDSESGVQHASYCDGIVEETVPHLRVQGGGSSTTTDSNGNWVLSAGGGSTTITSDLYGPYCDITNIGGAEASFSATAYEGTPLTVRYDDSNAQRDERTVFDGVNDIHDLIEIFDPGYGYSNTRMSAYVSRTTGYCPGNAWWDGTINFCAAGGSYANTGEIQGVTHHEFGHGIQDDILGWQGDQGLGEGNGDIASNLLTFESIIGRGFYVGNCSSGIRDSDNNLVYPDDVIGQAIHYAGQVIAGFHWDFMEHLKASYGEWDGMVAMAENWHFCRLLVHPTTQPAQVLAAFIADDDDGNLDNGTPHYDFLCEAAGNHGFDCPEILVGVFVNHETHPYSGDQSSGYEIAGTAVSLGGGVIDPSSTKVNYRIDGSSFSQIPMSPTGGADEYSAMIPAQSYGSVVEYYLEASNDGGDTGTSPRNAPAELHYFQVDNEFNEEMEFDTAWHIGTLTEETASTGNWERADPEGTSYNGDTVQPENDHTAAPGTDCWVTGALAGSSAGSHDIDGGQTVLYSPRVDLNGATYISISYWRYYTNNLGNNPGQDYWVVEISNDGGSSWTDVENSNASPNAWGQIAFNLDDYFTVPGVVQLRFTASDEGSGSLVEALVDDFTLMATFDMTGADDGIAVQFLTDLKQNMPNPFNPRTEIRFALETAGPARLAIYDASGRLVKELMQGRQEAGEHSIIWNGQDQNGQAVGSGVYFYRLDANGKTQSKRMVLLK